MLNRILLRMLVPCFAIGLGYGFSGDPDGAPAKTSHQLMDASGSMDIRPVRRVFQDTIYASPCSDIPHFPYHRHCCLVGW